MTIDVLHDDDAVIHQHAQGEDQAEGDARDAAGCRAGKTEVSKTLSQLAAREIEPVQGEEDEQAEQEEPRFKQNQSAQEGCQDRASLLGEENEGEELRRGAVIGAEEDFFGEESSLG